MNLKFLSFKNLSSLILLFSIFILDRISKIYVITLSGENFEAELYESTFLNIILIWNKGIAFGLLSFDQSYFYNLITIFITLIIFILIVLIFKSENLKKYSYILVTGGALGNLFDRIIYNSVPDFIDIHYNELHWFIFNIADIFITIGIICLIFDEIFLEKKI
jgi:signal peptidase II